MIIAIDYIAPLSERDERSVRACLASRWADRGEYIETIKATILEDGRVAESIEWKSVDG